MPLLQLIVFACGIVMTVFGGIHGSTMLMFAGLAAIGLPNFMVGGSDVGYVSKPAEVRRCLVLPAEFYDDFFDDKEFWLGWFRWQAELCGVDIAPRGVAYIDTKTGSYVYHKPPPTPLGPSGISPTTPRFPNPGITVRR